MMHTEKENLSCLYCGYKEADRHKENFFTTGITEVTKPAQQNNDLNLTDSQISNLAHALGLDTQKIKKCHKAYRNYFTETIGQRYYDELMDMVEKGLMFRKCSNKTMIFFSVTTFGVEYLSKITGVKIKLEEK